MMGGDVLWWVLAIFFGISSIISFIIELKRVREGHWCDDIWFFLPYILGFLAFLCLIPIYWSPG